MGFEPVVITPRRTPDRQDTYATLLTPRSSVAAAKSSIGFQPVVSAVTPHPGQAGCLCYFAGFQRAIPRFDRTTREPQVPIGTD